VKDESTGVAGHEAGGVGSHQPAKRPRSDEGVPTGGPSPQVRTVMRPPGTLHLRCGDLVEVRSKSEILATLDEEGKLDALPFMPEMLQYCGKRFPVYKRADKTCDTIEKTGLRRMENAVHLAGLRCDGSAHQECEAGCLLFWKESWLKKVHDNTVSESEVQASSASIGFTPACAPSRESSPLATLCWQASRTDNPGDPGGARYMCQATEIRKFTAEMSPWDLRQYWRDWSSKNVRLSELVRALAILLYNTIQGVRRGAAYPYLDGKLKKTPEETLNLQPGELVEVRSKEEILATVDRRLRNRGLSFDREMVKYCGHRYRVLRRVEKIVDEKTGAMMQLPKDCIILDGVICVGDLHEFCPRGIYPYWREIWLRRVEEPAGSGSAERKRL